MPGLTSSQREKIKTIAREFGVSEIAVFGSRARNSARDDSDVDLLVSFGSTVTLIKLVALKQAIEEAINLKVDLVESGGESPYLKQKIQASKSPL